MAQSIPNSYQDLLVQASLFENQPVFPPIDSLLQNFGMEPKGVQVQTPLYYVLDYVNKRYLHIAPSVASILGYTNTQLLESGPGFYMNLWHPDDLAVYSNKVVPATIKFLKEKSNSTRELYAVSHNHRLKNAFGNWLMFLQRSSYIWTDTGEIIGAFGFSIDITHFKESLSIIHTIERIDGNFNPTEQEPCYKMTYYPTNGIFSLREIQVLKEIYKGLSSKQIATGLKISQHTVHNHRKNLLEKSNCVNTAELIRFAVSHQLL
ncbi:MAG: helix-turn-helix transcriptional regulator [Cyclobacteriaceae bacterium]|nr:helix-turn-helix transcriptional regulator [Cyclobacteriaceae bacterium]